MTTSDTNVTPNELSFEHAIGRLEDIVGALENDELDLESSLKAYEEGVQLAKVCMEKLEKAELRIEELEIDDV